MRHVELDVSWIAAVTGAGSARRGARVQSLWSGYGELFRVELRGADVPSVVVKWVKPPAVPGSRPDVSHARKLRSYEVETNFYRTFAGRCDEGCRVPRLLGARVGDGERLLVLEDLDAAGFMGRRRRASNAELDVCLRWLARFHARFLGVAPAGLWRTGTYWHLATRPDELEAIEDEALRAAAPLLDWKLRGGRFHTLVHGDAKLANFCFAPRGQEVAAVDFQYVGGGCGMKDVAYLLHGEGDETHHLDVYFRALRDALTERPSGHGDTTDGDALEREWRDLYPLACVDFFRFLAGWAKEHWRSDTRAHQRTRDVLRQLQDAQNAEGRENDPVPLPGDD